MICGTDTLGVGINVPIHTVLLTGLTKFDGYKQRRLRSREFHQIAGRAGRSGFDTEGVVIAEAPEFEIENHLTKFDGYKQRRLRSREFHQIAGRAGRSGFDTEGVVIAEAPEFEIENHKAELKAMGDPKKMKKLKKKRPPGAGRSGFDTEGVVIAEAPEFEIENHKAELKAMGDPKKMKKLKKKRPPEGFVTWNEDTFTRLIESEPETLKPRLRITHSMVLAEVEQGGDAWERVLGFVTWNEDTFTRLIESEPETLKPRLRITHSMVLAEVEQGGDAWERVLALIDASLQTPEEKAKLKGRAAEIFATLIDAGVVVREACGTEARADGDSVNSVQTVSLTEAPENLEELRTLDAERDKEDDANDEVGRAIAEAGTATGHPLDGAANYVLTVDLPEDFALDQPLSPFLLAALELLDPESPTYTLDLISMVEATLEDPKQILRAQERRARDAAMNAMKAEGVDFEERLDRLQDVTYPKPLEEMLDAAFATYCAQVPWANDYELSPKSVLRDMLETGCDFKSYIAQYKIARCEGILLRYLTEAYRSLDRTVPVERRTEELDDIVSWLGLVVRSVDSSLVDEWANAGMEPGAAPIKHGDEVVADRRGMTLMVRNTLFQRVRLAALDRADALGDLDVDWGFPIKHGDEVVADRRGMTLMVRNTLFQRVRLAALDRADALGDLDVDWGFGESRWARVLDAFYEAHEDLLTDADARSTAFLEIDESDEQADHVWHVHQVFHDSDGDHDFGIMADVDLDATQDGDGIVFKNYRAGVIEDLVS